MKKERGVTITSLIIYVAALLVIAVIIGRITSFFYNNVNSLQDDSDNSNDRSKIELSLLNLFESEDLLDIEFGNYVLVSETDLLSSSKDSENTIDNDEENYSDIDENSYVFVANTDEDEEVTAIKFTLKPQEEVSKESDSDGSEDTSEKNETQTNDISNEESEETTSDTENENEVRIIGIINNNIYENKVLIGENISDFKITYETENVQDKVTYSINVSFKIGSEEYSRDFICNIND